MPTPKQEKLAEAIEMNIKLNPPLTKGQLLESAGYGAGTAKGSPLRTIEQKGVQEALAERGFTEENAKKVIGEIIDDKRVKADTKIRAAQEIFKVHGSYAPEKRVVQQMSVEGTPQDYVEATKLAQKYEQEYLDTLK